MMLRSPQCFCAFMLISTTPLIVYCSEGYQDYRKQGFQLMKQRDYRGDLTP